MEEDTLSDMEQRQIERSFSLKQLTIENLNPASNLAKRNSLSHITQESTTLIEKLRPYVSLHVLRRLGRLEDGVDFDTYACPVVKHFKGSVAIVDMS